MAILCGVLALLSFVLAMALCWAGCVNESLKNSLRHSDERLRATEANAAVEDKKIHLSGMEEAE